jgi:peptide deformylase
MAVKSILQLGDPRLREIALPVADPSAPEVAVIVKDLADTLAHWRAATGYGRGIATPQLGVPMRVIFLQLPGEKPWPLINPEILERSEEKIVVWDACLSFLSIFMQVERSREITVRYQDMKGETHRFRAGTTAIFPNSCSTKSTISMASWPSTVSPTLKPSVPAKNLKSVIVRAARTPRFRLQSKTE